jgi:hypothetical protein
MQFLPVRTSVLSAVQKEAFDAFCQQKNGRPYFSDLLDGPQDFLVEDRFLDEQERAWLREQKSEPQQGWCIWPEAVAEQSRYQQDTLLLVDQRFWLCQRSTSLVVVPRETILSQMLSLYLLSLTFSEDVLQTIAPAGVQKRL